MNQNYQNLTDDELELVEKQTLRMIVQALQEYSKEAREIFETTPATSKTEVIVLAEDLVQYALEVAETYPINRRFAGFIDYKRIRWLPTPYGLLPQALLVDAKASTENNRDTLQQSQLPMDADFASNGKQYSMKAGFPPHMDLTSANGVLHAVTTSIFIHFHYTDLKTPSGPSPKFRELHSIYVLALPHGRLKSKYNPDATKTFFAQGKHSPARNEEPRIRVYFAKLRKMEPWRLQQLVYAQAGFSEAQWRDGPSGAETITPFSFFPR